MEYPGFEHSETTSRVIAASKACTVTGADVIEIPPTPQAIEESLTDLVSGIDVVVCDITGFSRALILRTLTRISQRNLQLVLLYTEAKEYYPLRAEFKRFLEVEDANYAFAQLAEYENAELVYSAKCSVEEIEELPGALFPNHPLLLIAFLAFKRSRLSSILNQYETNARILISSVPVRRELRWRERALDIINFDLIQGNKLNVVRLPTLSWTATSEFLSRVYTERQCGYRYNVLLAPLGGKMQTVGAWYFAMSHPDVKVISSTPNRFFPEKYSRGFTNTHVVELPVPQSLSSLRGETTKKSS